MIERTHVPLTPSTIPATGTPESGTHPTQSLQPTWPVEIVRLSAARTSPGAPQPTPPQDRLVQGTSPLGLIPALDPELRLPSRYPLKRELITTATPHDVQELLLAPSSTQRLAVMSLNCLSNAVIDDGVYRWNDRRHCICDVIRRCHVDLAGLQELTLRQVRDLEHLLAPQYGIVAYSAQSGLFHQDVAEGDQGAAGCWNALIWRQDRLQLLASEREWLAEPEARGRIAPVWSGASEPRILVSARFEDVHTHQQLAFCTTHLDCRSAEARLGAVKQLDERLDILTAGGECPVILTGDFNCFPDSGGQQVLDGLTTRLNYARDEATHVLAQWTSGTFVGYPSDPCRTPIDPTGQIGTMPIDLVLYSPGRLRPLLYTPLCAQIDAQTGRLAPLLEVSAAAAERSRRRHYVSDHVPVITVFERPCA